MDLVVRSFRIDIPVENVVGDDRPFANAFWLPPSPLIDERPTMHTLDRYRRPKRLETQNGCILAEPQIRPEKPDLFLYRYETPI